MWNERSLGVGGRTGEAHRADFRVSLRINGRPLTVFTQSKAVTVSVFEKRTLAAVRRMGWTMANKDQGRTGRRASQS